MLGLLLGVGLAVARELLDTSVKGADDIAQITAAPVLGNIISDSRAAKRAPSEVLFTGTPWAEAFRVLRTNMQYVDVDHDQKVFVVTSSAARRGQDHHRGQPRGHPRPRPARRSPLVECDLRRPLIADRARASTARSAPPAC